MSALAMMLSAALVAGSAQEKVSAETRQALDLRGKWEGILIASKKGHVYEGTLQGGVFVDTASKVPQFYFNLITEQGGGKFIVRSTPEGTPYAGLYSDDGDILRICVCRAEQGMPTQLKAGGGCHLFILRRVKPRKEP